MDAAKDDTPGMTQADKLRTQAETGEGRSMARPGGTGMAPGVPLFGTAASDMPVGAGTGSLGIHGESSADSTSGMSGAETNDAMPGGGGTGDRPLPDTVDPKES